MKTYLLNIPKNLKKFSLKLDVETLLCSKSWEVFNGEGNKEIYIFQKDGNLVISTNGNVVISTWQFIPVNLTIIIKEKDKATMFRPAFMDKVVFVMQKDGTKEYLFLIDEHEQAICPHRTLDELFLYFANKIEEGSKHVEENRQAIRQAKRQQKRLESREGNRKKQQELHEKLQREQMEESEQLRLDDIAYLHKNEIDLLVKQRSKKVKKGILFTNVAMVIAIILSVLFEGLDMVHRLFVFISVLALLVDIPLMLSYFDIKARTKEEIVSKYK